ncbi:MAG: cation:proton antiporter, partial [Candidatus Woesearchaeota archaeon]
MTINVRKLYKNIAAPFTFGMIAVGLTIATVAVFAKMILGLDYIFGLILGSILASTDLTIIAPIFNSMKVKPQVKEFIEIESSINSIFAAVFVVVLINLYETGAKLAFNADILSTGLQTLLYNIFVGAGLGLVIGYLILRFITK